MSMLQTRSSRRVAYGRSHRVVLAAVVAAIFAVPAGTAGNACVRDLERREFSGAGISLELGANRAIDQFESEDIINGTDRVYWATIKANAFYGLDPWPECEPLEDSSKTSTNSLWRPTGLSVESQPPFTTTLGDLWPVALRDMTIEHAARTASPALGVTPHQTGALQTGAIEFDPSWIAFEIGTFEAHSDLLLLPTPLESFQQTLVWAGRAAMLAIDRHATLRWALAVARAPQLAGAQAGPRASAAGVMPSHAGVSAEQKTQWSPSAALPIAQPLAREERGLFVPLVIEAGPLDPWRPAVGSSLGAEPASTSAPASGIAAWARTATGQAVLVSTPRSATSGSTGAALRPDLFERLMQWLAMAFGVMVVLIPAGCAWSSTRVAPVRPARPARPSSATDAENGGFLAGLSTGLARAPSY